MIARNASFSSIIIVFGLERALGKKTIADFGGSSLKKQYCAFGQGSSTYHI
ncbi:hypothetical protein Scep_000189 [Stephania cephalantha]|uniref:Uncharacterized protein n=1 Tax=Stephania cephalantha TaxID=152367 RepID=A0AAP0L5N6_9MAGN